MQNKSDLLKNISIKEKCAGLYEHKIFGVSFWRLVRLPILRSYLLREYNIGKADVRTKKRKLETSKFFAVLSDIFLSFLYFCKIIFFKRKDVQSVILAFPRLQKIGNEHVCKFTDPLIEYSKIKDSYLVFQRHHSGKHYENRLHSKHTFRTDFISFISKFLSFLFFPIVFIAFSIPMLKLFITARKEFSIPRRAFISFILKLTEFIISSKLYYFIFKRLKVKQVFLVNREIFFAETFACKQLGIKTYELQHGITHGWTLLYSGCFDEKLDTDNFLSFGSNWNGKQFGVPVERIINIGWAYNTFIAEKVCKVNKVDSILIISDWLSTMLPLIEQLSSRYCHNQFHIRPHPNDSISNQLLNKIDSMPNVKLLDNTIESIVVLQSYNQVVGLSSTALFEALSLNIKVGVLNFGGCTSLLSPNKFSKALYFMSNLDDFDLFLNAPVSEDIDASLFYGKFDAERVNGLLALT